MSTVFSVIALVFSAAAVAVAIWTGTFNKRSAVAAEGSQLAADRSADAAKESAFQASRSADAAERVARAEAFRDHETFRPRPPELKHPALKIDTREERRGRYLTFTVDRTYRVAGDIVNGASRTPLHIDPVIGAGDQIRVWVDEATLPADSLHLRFWPAAPEDRGEKWECPCGGPIRPEDGPMHWEWILRLPDRPKPARFLSPRTDRLPTSWREF